MKKHVLTLALLGFGAVSTQAFAQIDEALASQSGCLACHKQSEKLIGPSYDEVYEKYKDDDGAVDYLIEKVTAGGSGVWGAVPMTPNGHIPAEDIETLVLQIMHEE